MSQPNPGAPDHPPMKRRGIGQILLLLGVAIALFIGFSAYSIQQNLESRAQLTAINARYFPLLQNLDADIVRVDKLEEAFTQTVVTGDRDLLDSTKETVAQTDQALSEIAKLDPKHADEAARLRLDLHRYADLANQACLAFLEKDRRAAVPIAAAMNRALAQVRHDLKDFRQTSYDRFVGTLTAAERTAAVSLTLGLILGLMNLASMGVLVRVIRSNLKMMTVIEEQNATLEQRIAERTAQLSQKTSDLNAMLQNMSLGVVTIVPGNRIHPEYSRHMRTIFLIEDLADKDVVEQLFGNSSLGIDARDQVKVGLAAMLGEDQMMFDCNCHLLPREMHLNTPGGGRKMVQMTWTPIVDEAGTVVKVLLVAEDVTQLRALEATAVQQGEELTIIERILAIPAEKFAAFIASARNFLDANRNLLELTEKLDSEVISALFRNMHTVKGNARTFDFTQITNAAHRAEQSYDELRKKPDANMDRGTLIDELAAVEAAVARYVRVSEDTLGRKGRALDALSDHGTFVHNEDLANLRASIDALNTTISATTVFSLRSRVEKLGLITLPRLLNNAVDSLPSMAAELGKPAPEVEIDGTGIGLNPKFAVALKDSLMHMFRNSLDHGIEAPAERMGANKPARGRIRLACQHRGERVEIRFKDDGRGLPLERLYQQGVASGLFSADQRPTRAAVADLIFRAGLSTASKVTEVSGRGVGMDAVRTFLSDQGATIELDMENPNGTELGFAPFEFVIKVPLDAVTYAAAVTQTIPDPEAVLRKPRTSAS